MKILLLSLGWLLGALITIQVVARIEPGFFDKKDSENESLSPAVLLVLWPLFAGISIVVALCMGTDQILRATLPRKPDPVIEEAEKEVDELLSESPKDRPTNSDQ